MAENNLPPKLERWLVQLQDPRFAPDPMETVGFLQQLEGIAANSRQALLGPDGKPIAGSLLPLLQSPHWRCKGKALITIGRTGQSDIAAPVLAWGQQQKAPHWQLQALDAWWQLPVPSLQRQQTIAALLAWAKEPVTIRGVVWLIAQCPGAAMTDLLAGFINNPCSAIIKDEFLTYAWQKVSRGLSTQQLTAITGHYLNLRVWLKYREFNNKAIYGLYPNQDYLWQLAKTEGISQKEFKSLYFKPRNKKQIR